MPTMQLHFDFDLNDKRSIGLLLAAFNAIASFEMHAGPRQGPQGPAPATTAAPAAPKPPRKPRGGAAAAPAPQPEANGAEPELPMGPPPYQPGPPQYQQPQPGAPTASFGQPVPGGYPQWPQQPQQGPGDYRQQLNAELRDFTTKCGPMALQGLLAYFGAETATKLPMDRAEEIFQYIRAARAQMQPQA